MSAARRRKGAKKAAPKRSAAKQPAAKRGVARSAVAKRAPSKRSAQPAPADGLYPQLPTLRTGRLRVSPVHELYFEESGNRAGKPVVFLHGGPGGGTNREMRRFFDPKRYRIILFDQRGCGKSTPHASLVDNTTWDLVADTEKLREHLGIDRWQVFGGSWGSTLALAYAQKHPDRVTELVLRGIFLLRRSELEWFYQSSEGAASLFPDLWEEYVAPIPEEERYDMIGAYYRRLTSSVAAERNAAARSWSIWEGATSHLRMDPGYIAKFKDADYAAAFARIECHYFVNGGFLDADDQLLRDVGKIRHIPATIVQGRYDVVCPMRSAWHLHRAWPEAELVVVPDAGHSAFESGIARALRKAADKYARGRRK